MSDPKLQRADGCSIFFTLILAAAVILAFYFIPKFFTTEPPPHVAEDISKQRQGNIDAHKLEAEKFENRIDSYHSENNSSIESVMQKVVDGYEANRSSDH
jgi:hypothetical protein